MEASINRQNVGRIAERIVSNELEYRGFRVSDLNKEGTAANADVLAAKNGKTWQIQVKGSTWDDGWWFGYGFCTQAIIDGPERMFNRSLAGFYEAEIVALVCVKSPKDYDCLILPVEIAESAAQINLAASFRMPRRDGSAHRPGKVWVSLDYTPHSNVAEIAVLRQKERDILMPYRNNWEWVESKSERAAV